MSKRLLRASWIQAALGLALAGYMQLVKATTRWSVHGLDAITPIWDGGQGVVGCVWHARVLMTIAGWPKNVQPATILISRSPDGEFVAHAAKHHGIGVIRGSARNPRKDKDKGGAPAFRAMIEHVANGGCLAVTPDGPRGPRMRASLGAVRLSRATGAPMMAYAWSTSGRIVFNSWDRFILPLPFSKGVIVWKGPIAPPESSEPAVLEAKRLELEAAMNEAARQADEASGRPAIEPAPAHPERPPARTPTAERTA